MKILVPVVALFALFTPTRARAQSANGFTLERYEPTPAGEWSFWVDHPWYTRSKQFAAAGLTFDYGHNPLVFGTVDANGFRQTQAVVAHELAMHVDVAASFLDRINLSLTLPVVLFERGSTAVGVSPLGGGVVGDPRVGGMVRVFGQPLSSALSLHVGAFIWIPVGANGNHAGDSTVRFMPKVALGGFVHHLLWSFTAAFQYRKDASLGALPAGSGNTVGSELQLGAAIAYADFRRRFAIGPEAVVATVLTAGGGNVFAANYTSVEILAAGHYNIARMIQAGLAVGLGAAREPGTPDLRVLFRVAYAPLHLDEPRAQPRDRDGDGIADADDACPDERGARSIDPVLNGCPARDRDGDGITDADDRCPDVAAGNHPDPQRRGCPEQDSDGDGIVDSIDQCPAVPAGPHADAKKPGCPDVDSDGDGIFDSLDQCPSQPAGLHPDPSRLGCPAPDADNDQIPDSVDACPDQPGAPDPDPKKNGCPGLVQIKGGKLVIMEPVFFATNKDVILPRSFPVLQAVANALSAQAELKHISIEGHTDSQGKPDKNLDLSARRAASVLRWLVDHGVSVGRLESHGFGQTQPVANNRTAAGRAANRRVEFRIVDEAGKATPKNE